MHNKGFFGDIFTIIIFLFVISIVLLITLTAFTGVKSGFDDAGIGSAGMDSVYNALLMFDKLFLLIVAGGFIGLVVSAFMIDTHPIYFVVTLFILSVVFIVAQSFSDSYVAIASGDGFSVAGNQLYYTGLIMSNLSKVVMIYLAGFFIALYGKMKMN